MRFANAWVLSAAVLWLASTPAVIAPGSASAAEPVRQTANPRDGTALRLALGQTGERPTSTADSIAAQHWKDAAPATFSLTLRQAPRLHPREGILYTVDRGLSEAATPIEVEFAARIGETPVSVAVAQRTSGSEDAFGRVELLGREFRLGNLGIGEFKSPTWDNPQWYIFAASDGSAVTWTPMSRAERVEALRLQEERVQIGDLQVGISAEANGLQASLAYIKREASNGQRSEDASFTGLSLTWRR